jgi:outer membrane immunogenic protein
MPRRVLPASACGLLACLIAGSARAADLGVAPVKAAFVPVSTNWSGLFIGAEGGTGWGTDQLFFPGPLTRTSSFDTSGALAGVVIGTHFQLPGSNWVFGIEGNLDWADIKGTTSCPLAGFSCSTKLDAYASGTGRIGYAWSSFLLYGKAGFAWGRDRAWGASATGAVVEHTTRIGRSGYTLGAGIEYMFAPNWAAKLEYDYTQFDSRTVAAKTPAGTFIENIELSGRSFSTIKGGINYHFNWVPPAVLVRN